MPTRRTLDLAIHLLVLDGVAALYLGEFLALPVAVAVTAALAGTFWLACRGKRLASTSGLARVLVPVAAAASAADVLYLAATALDGLVRLLLFLVLYKLVTLRSVRDARTAAFLGFFMLVAASASAFDVWFLFVYLAFVVLATWVLLLQQAVSEAEPAPGRVVVGPEVSAGSRRAFLGLAVAASAAVAAISGALFLVIPRVGLAALPLRAPVGQMVTGFTDRVELGAYGQIETDASVVMRVHIGDGVPDPERLPNLRWRGIVFDAFDGRAWTSGQRQRTTLRRSVGGDFWVAAPRTGGRILTQEIFLEPIGTDIIFAAARPVRFRLRAPELQVDDTGSVSVSTPLARLAYTVDSELETLPALTRGVPARHEPLDRGRFLQLPTLPSRIPELARRVAAGSRDQFEVAQRLTGFLSREFRYTLTLERQTTLEPLDEFLFVRRAGNCEYFAASLAVMLRSLGIPARVVGGFQRGQWNPYGRYFMVRLADAHSWVEAYVDGAGWITLDPSPRGDGESVASPTSWRLYLDALRLQWYRYVINWSIRDQVQAAVAIRRQAVGLRAWLSVARESLDARALAAGVVVAVAGLAALRAVRRGGAWPARATTRTLHFYERALRALARRGVRPQVPETAREFSARVAHLLPGCAAPFGQLTVAYERCRFGAARLTSDDAADLAACVAALDRA
jgi:protein-glutamine gamma-glutamyltransferase